MKTETVKGFKDFTGEEARKREEIRKILVETFEKFGFEPAETPVIEYEEFVRGDNVDDEAVSDVFRLQDKGKRKLALRYEWTFQLKRLMKNQKTPYKRYQVGPVFRDEPVSANRFRQFVQCDVDTVGSTTKEEAEVLAVANDVLKKLGIDFVIYVNNRKLLNEILEGEGVKEKETVIREIDKLDKLSEEEIKKNLVKFKAGKVLEIFKKPEGYFKNYKAYSEIKELKDYCKGYGVEVKFSPSLARGLSYYNGSVFEIKAKGTKDTITGGGSYEFNKVQCTGISFGLDRLAGIAKVKSDRESYLIVSLNQDKEAIKLSQKLRAKDKNVSIIYGKPSKALQYANSYGVGKVIFVGEKEVKSKKFMVKDMESGKESLLGV